METGPDSPAGSVVDPLLRELDRIAGSVESRRAAEDRALIDALTHEVAQLQAAVAHLRAAATPLPGHLRPAVARALVAVRQESA